MGLACFRILEWGDFCLFNFNAFRFENIELFHNDWISFLVDDTRDAGDGDHACADAARVFGDVEGGAFQGNAVGGCQGETPLFGADTIADFSLVARWNIHDITDAANLAAVVLLVPVVVVLHEDFSVSGKKRANFGTQTLSLRFFFVQELEKFSVFRGDHRLYCSTSNRAIKSRLFTSPTKDIPQQSDSPCFRV